MGRGRYMKAHQLYKYVQNDIMGGATRDLPAWYDVLHSIPPSEILVRTRPAQLNDPDPKMRVPRNTFRPQEIVFLEDELRRRFFADHPWELARPRIIAENKGTESRRFDWSMGLRQSGMPLCGECVVQRQMYLMQFRKMSRETAYDAARKEFYRLRHQEEADARVQREESQMYGGTFGPGWVDIGTQLEDKNYMEWLNWAKTNVSQLRSEREARSSGSVVVDDETEILEAEVDGNAQKVKPQKQGPP